MPLLDVSTYLPQLFWLFISFVLLYFLLSKFCVPQLQNIILLRDEKVNEALEKARIAQTAAVKLRDEYEAILQQAILAKGEMIAKVSHELALEIEKKSAEHDLEFAKMVAESDKRLKAFKSKSSSIVSDIAREAAKNILQDFLGIEVKESAVNAALKSVNKSTEESHA